uniref:NAD dependent epimerase/dehydratase family protein n=1 Tax=Hydrogenovibrio crunogenus (strain DSM 25203 / XCL-2) TaxID=317025 RepID=Q31F02_HYDCU
MKPDSHSNKVLITGLDGFTGQYLKSDLELNGFQVVGLTANLIDREAVISEVLTLEPDYVVHLAGISFAASEDTASIYSVNVSGTVNLLDGLSQLNHSPKKTILASSATVYGNVTGSVLSESICPKPISHYGCSKLAMEHMAQNYTDKFPLIITRPFNYTGIGHAEHFLIPKIVKAYQDKKTVIELGNLDVSREFNDVRDICKIYLDLLLSEKDGITVNVCSGKTVSLMSIVSLMDQIAGYKMNVKVNPAFVRENEIKDLSGDVSYLNDLVKPEFKYGIEDTLRWMYGEIYD